MGDAFNAGEDDLDGRMREWKLKCGRAKRDAVTFADTFDGRNTGNKLGRRWFVVETQRLPGWGSAGGENSGVERTAKSDAGAARLAQRQQFAERAVVDQGVAAGKQQAVEALSPEAPRRRSASD